MFSLLECLPYISLLVAKAASGARNDLQRRIHFVALRFVETLVPSGRWSDPNTFASENSLGANNHPQPLERHSWHGTIMKDRTIT